jgi:hypothetical protein
MKYLIIFLFTLSICQTWDYKKHGDDWKNNFPECNKSQISPMKINSKDAEKISSKYYFFPKMNKNIKGKLQLMEQDNLLILNYQEAPLGELMFNIKNYSNEKIKVGEFINLNCHSISFKIPGEHIFNNKKYDAELQVNCTDIFKGELIWTFVSIPVLKVNDSIEQSHIFDEINNCIKGKNLSVDITINDFKDFLDIYTMMDNVYYYNGHLNYLLCNNNDYWFFVERNLIIKENVLKKLKSYLNNIK